MFDINVCRYYAHRNLYIFPMRNIAGPVWILFFQNLIASYRHIAPFWDSLGLSLSTVLGQVQAAGPYNPLPMNLAFS